MISSIRKKPCVFDSCYGYSSLLRLGKIYIFEKEHYNYILNTYIDIIDFSIIFKRFFNLCKYKLKIKILKKYLSLKDLHDRQLGLCNINYLINKYYEQHISSLRNKS